MRLKIENETSALTDVCVCLGTAVPPFKGYFSEHREHENFPMLPWDQVRLVEQQEQFFKIMNREGVRLHSLPHSAENPWQLYTRDVGFVVGDTLFYSRERTLPDRTGEIEVVHRALPDLKMTEIKARIEGGDVLVDGDTVFVGLGTRSTPEGIAELAAHVDVEIVPIYLGPKVMHLDCRMNILPGRRLLTYPGDFKPDDLAMLKRRFTLIEVSETEAQAMGTNCLTINPELVVMHSGFERLIAEVEATGLRVERVDYSEPNALLGSFRCSTMPLVRAS